MKNRIAFVCASFIGAVSLGSAVAQQPDALLVASGTAAAADMPGYKFSQAPDRFTTFVSRARRFTTVPIDQTKLEEFCSDFDGCTVRIGMHNWDDTQRIASREFLFFYNAQNGNWRASLGDTAGSDKNNVTQHVNNSWSCYMTDAQYVNERDNDSATGFGLLSWRQYNADCVLTIID